MSEPPENPMLAKIRSQPHQPHQEGRYVLRVMVTTGRHTGRSRPVPMAVSQLDGHKYVCAPNRRRDWVLNLLATGRCELEGEPVPGHEAVLVEDVEAARAVNQYLGVLNRISPAWPFEAGATVPQIAEHVHEIAVFRLDPGVG